MVYPVGRLDARATRLAAQLNQRYLAFTDELPPLLQRLARLASTYKGIPGTEPFSGVTSLNPGLTGTPWLFWPLFGCLDDETLLSIAEAGSLMVLASIVLDHLVDAQLEQREGLTLLQNALQQAGTVRFRRIFSNNASFWPHFERLAAEHTFGLAAEIEARSSPASLTLENLVSMVRAKFAAIVITIAALAEASDQPDVTGAIEESIKRLAVASQLLDDIGDWASDRESQHLTFYLAQLAPPECWLAPAWPDATELQAQIDATWHDAHYLRLTLEWLNSARTAVGGLDCPGWVAYQDSYRDSADRHLTAATARHLARSLRTLLPQGPG